MARGMKTRPLALIRFQRLVLGAQPLVLLVQTPARRQQAQYGTQSVAHALLSWDRGGFDDDVQIRDLKREIPRVGADPTAGTVTHEHQHRFAWRQRQAKSEFR